MLTYSFLSLLTLFNVILSGCCVCNVSVRCFDKMLAVCVSHLIDPHPHGIRLRHELFLLTRFYGAKKGTFPVLFSPALQSN